MGYDLNRGRCFNFHPFTGFKMVFIEQKLNTFYSGLGTGSVPVFDQLKQKVDMDGYGATLGFNATYRFFDCVNFLGGFSYDILASDFDRHNLFTTLEASGAITNISFSDDCWKAVSAFNFMFGLKYNTQLCGCYNVSFGVGYEFHHYLNLIDFIGFDNPDPISGSTGIYRRDNIDLDLDGLFVRLEIGF